MLQLLDIVCRDRVQAFRTECRTNSDMPRDSDRRVGSGEGVARIVGGSRLSLQTAIGVAVLLAVAVPAWAADPIIGTWRLNVAKSTFSIAMQKIPPKELTEVIREVDNGRIELAQTRHPEGRRAGDFSHYLPR